LRRELKRIAPPGAFRTQVSLAVFREGARVRIVARKEVGSAYLLRGLTGTILGPHPIAEDWVRVLLDPNEVTPYREWPVPKDRLEPLKSPLDFS
jgi:hypothetical protein